MAFLRREFSDHVLTLTMSSPDTRNALTGAEQFDDFVQTCAEINDDMSIRAVVLTGEGSAFCAGGNVKDMRDRAGMFSGDPFDQAGAYRMGIQRIPRAIQSLNVPIIARLMARSWCGDVTWQPCVIFVWRALRPCSQRALCNSGLFQVTAGHGFCRVRWASLMRV